ncbi:A disintegrin and metalloproteinase with thrombospondin motifs 6-like [Onthophagus taurus]|uniref:A disintegrin and metalloproteinase with thrombospondin motifs 6-like n=1 Tax=Onthophagus taurus TaxID=166361 RepID=UPI0039BE50E8
MVHRSLILLIILAIHSLVNSLHPIHGRYTRNIDGYQLAIPRKLNRNGKFLSFSLPHFYKHNGDEILDNIQKRRRRSIDDAVHYGVLIDGEYHKLRLWPNRKLLSPRAIIEKRNPNIKPNERYVRSLDGEKICHYTGKIRGQKDSKVALSTCNGLAGYIMNKGDRYFVEPLEGHSPNKRGHHVHMIYKRSTSERIHKPIKHCGTDDDWAAAWKEQLKRNYELYGGFRNESKRGLQSIHRHMEILIVCDKRFIEHHKNEDILQYILTVMNMVYDYYHDATAGNQVDVIIVRIIYLEKEEEEIDLLINHDSSKTLESFCKWQITVNPKDIHNPNHHDVAVLLTRHDLCATNGGSCDLMGLAYVGTACNPNKNCGINEDAGLLLGIVVAHEVGHIMGCAHDTPQDSGCESKDSEGSYHIMAPFVHLNTRRWSACSKTFMTTLFDNDLGECLNDEPEVSLYQYEMVLPGVVYDSDYQCRQIFPGSETCIIDPMKSCEELLCRKPGEDSCKSDGSPPAEGTKCGPNKWCIKMKCVEVGERPQATNGGWGEWSDFSKCSRTCGGGVSYASRNCDNPIPKNGGRYCIGERKKVKICNTTPCPEGCPSYRAAQCSEYNKQPWEGRIYVWLPYLLIDKPCELHCINQDNVYVKLAPRAKDGTKCKAGTHDMCISGHCAKVGCDFQINSNAIEDICGVCQGDGTTCKSVENTYAGPPGHEYVKIVVIPKGSRNIIVDEKAPSVNTIAVSDEDNKYYLNGEFTEVVDGEKDFGGVEGMYTHPEPGKELLEIHGPLKKNLVVYVVFYQAENVGYFYNYAEPSLHSNYQPHYHWEFLEWNDCSVRCGGGTQSSEPSCVEEKAGRVSDTFCHNMEKPIAMVRRCNDAPCKVKWRTGKWSKCTACKNQSGIRVREVECVRENPISGADDILVEDTFCPPPKPGTRELCDAQKSCTKKREIENEIPSYILRELWYQTIVDYVNADSAVRRSIMSAPRTMRTINRDLKRHLQKSLSTNPDECLKLPMRTNPKKEKQLNKGDLHVGTIIQDRIPNDELKLIEIPLKQLGVSMNISDSVFESLGEQVPDTLDFEHKRVCTGKQAADKLTAAAHMNNTI